jgi:hypothetical protein
MRQHLFQRDDLLLRQVAALVNQDVQPGTSVRFCCCDSRIESGLKRDGIAGFRSGRDRGRKRMSRQPGF